MVTTDGSILAAAAATVPSSCGLCDAGRVLTLIGAATGPAPATRVAYEPTPAPAPINAANAIAANIVPSLRRGWGTTSVPGRISLSGRTPAGAGKSAAV